MANGSPGKPAPDPISTILFPTRKDVADKLSTMWREILCSHRSWISNLFFYSTEVTLSKSLKA